VTYGGLLAGDALPGGIKLKDAAQFDVIGQDRARLDAWDVRMQTVLPTVAREAGWGKAGANRYLGLAAHNWFGTAVAQVVEISLQGEAVRIEKITIPIFCNSKLTL